MVHAFNIAVPVKPNYTRANINRVLSFQSDNRLQFFPSSIAVKRRPQFARVQVAESMSRIHIQTANI
jgi:hypothetical protein